MTKAIKPAFTKKPPRALRVLGADMTRTCGECRACCVAFGVHDGGVNKEPGKPCHHLRPAPTTTACEIYEERPASCRAFRCFWLQGMGHDDDRPDRTGVVVGAQVTAFSGDPRVRAPGVVGRLLDSAAAKTGNLVAMVVTETTAGSFGAEARRLVDAISAAAPVFVMFRDGRRKLLGPAPVVAAMTEAARAAERAR